MNAVVLLLVSLVAFASALHPLLLADSPTRLDGRYIVVLKSSLLYSEVTQHVRELEADFVHSSGNNYILSPVPFEIGNFKGYSAVLSADMLARERSHPDVVYVEVDQKVGIDCVTQRTIVWNLDRISETLLDLDGFYYYKDQAGAGVTIYIIDTGIFIDNEDFGTPSRASWGFAMDRNMVDGNGHGTHVASSAAGVTYGVAKQASLVAVKVLDANGSGTTAGVIDGVNWATSNHRSKGGASVANMSLGGGASPSLVSAVESSIAAGITYAVAAGNDNANACNYSPANSPNAITAGATTSTDTRASFSNWGTCVDIFAPGNTITAAWIGARNAVRTISGTSMASPHIAGAAAIVLSVNPSWGPQRVKDDLLFGATNGVLTNIGTNSPNRLLHSAC